MLKFNGKKLDISASRGADVRMHNGDTDGMAMLDGHEGTVLCAEIRNMLQKHHEQLTECMQGWVDQQNKLVASLVGKKADENHQLSSSFESSHTNNGVDIATRICNVLDRHEIVLNDVVQSQRLRRLGASPPDKNRVCRLEQKNRQRKTDKMNIARTMTEGVMSAVKSMTERTHSFTLDMSQEDALRKTKAEEMEGSMSHWRNTQSFLGRNPCFWISSSYQFEIFFAAAIITNSVFVGIQVDWTAGHPGEEPPVSFYAIQHLYAFLFLVELIMRMCSDKFKNFFCSEQWNWNMLDVFIVTTSIFEVVMDILHLTQEGGASEGVTQNTSNMRIVRIIRITRLIRVFRIIRVIRFVHALRTLVYSIVCTMKSLVWAMLLLVMIIYVFGILFTEATTYHLIAIAESDDVAFDDIVFVEGTRSFMLDRYWGSLPRSMFTLFKAISGGISWDIVVLPLADIGWIWVFVFTVFIAFAYFAVLNVVTGVFCQSAIETAQQNEDLVIQTQIANKKMYVERIRRLFKDMDIDNSGDITIREFEKHLNEDSMQAYFASLDLDTSDAWTLFKLLDTDEGNAIDVDEFIMGCLRLKGNAKSIDIAKMSCENKFMMKKMGTFMKFVELELESLTEVLHEITCGEVGCDGLGLNSSSGLGSGGFRPVRRTSGPDASTGSASGSKEDLRAGAHHDSHHHNHPGAHHDSHHHNHDANRDSHHHHGEDAGHARGTSVSWKEEQTIYPEHVV